MGSSIEISGLSVNNNLTGIKKAATISCHPLNLLHPLRVGNGVEHHFIGLSEKVHRPSQHLKMLRLPVGHKFFPAIPFFKKKEPVFILDTLAEVATPASLLHPYRAGQ